jgi:hypothetical protein
MHIGSTDWLLHQDVGVRAVGMQVGRRRIMG